MPQISLEEEYKKDTGITPEDITQLQEWLKSQSHLPQNITELDMILALWSCRRSTMLTKQLLDTHFTLKTHLKEYFKDRTVDSKIEKTCHISLMSPLATRAYDGSACIYLRLLDNDAKKFIFVDAIRTVLMVTELWQYQEGTWPGFTLVVDLDTLTLSHLACLDLMNLHKFFYYLQKGTLLIIKGLHFINAPPFMDKLLAMMRPFLEKELLDVLKIHQVNTRTLEKYYPMDALPKGAGGSYKSFEECRDATIENLKANEKFFAEENTKRVDEGKRPGKPKSVSDFFGSVEGSFKKLDFD